MAKKKTAPARKKPAAKRAKKKLAAAKPEISAGRGLSFRSRYDAAQTGPENREHWRGVDSLSPNGAANAEDRKRLRERARYEVANNPYAFGASNALAEDLVGTVPRLQMNDLDDKVATAIEDSFGQWASAIGLADSLRLMVRAGVVDGEAFALATDNPKLAHDVKLDWRVFECDRVTDPTAFIAAELVDGIEYDSFGNPTRYKVLREHPGDGGFLGLGEYDTYPAEVVYHWYRPDRPGQARGVSWLTPALQLFAVLRRYTYAVLLASETAANIGGVVKSDLPPGSEPADVKDREEVPVPRGTLYTLPPGWDITQIKAEQPTQQFGDFRSNILAEIGRVLDMPLNRITGNSSGYNYSSGRLDHLGYHASLWRLRARLALRILDRLFRAWLDEAALVGILPDGLPPFAELSWDWMFDGFGDIDPVKDATAATALIQAGLSTLSEQCALRGLRWDWVQRQLAREMELRDSLGLTPAAPPAAQKNDPPPDEDDDQDDDEEEEDDTDEEEEEEEDEEEVAT
jgi:lambda family phage portal protein